MPDLQNHITKGWTRKLSFNEKLYTISETINAPCAIQFLLHGEGNLEATELQTAINELCEKIPAVKLKRNRKHWQINPEVPQLKVHQSSFPSSLNNTFTKQPLLDNTIIEFHLFKANNDSLFIRVAHAAMDGIGLLTIVQSLFKRLNKTEQKAITAYPIEDDLLTDLLVNKSVPKRAGYQFKWKGIAGNKGKSTTAYNFSQINLTSPNNNLTGNLAKWYMDYIGEDAQFLIPVNIRRHLPQFESVANLSLPIYLQTQLNQTAEDIHHNLLQDLYQNKELAKDRLTWFGKLIPSKILRKVLIQQIAKAQRNNKFPMSGYLSDLGFIDLNALKTSTFKTVDFIPIPVHISLAPFCAFACHHQNGTRITLSLPEAIDQKAITTSIKKKLSKLEIPSIVTSEKNGTHYLKDTIETIWTDTLDIKEGTANSNTSFTSSGGTSLQLILLLQKIEKELPEHQRKAFFKKALKRGGAITIEYLLTITKLPTNEN